MYCKALILLLLVCTFPAEVCSQNEITTTEANAISDLIIQVQNLLDNLFKVATTKNC